MKLTVTRKLALSYVVIALTSLIAIIYALTNLRTQTENTAHLFGVDFKALTLSRDLRNNVLAQETLGKQFAILKSPELVELLDGREREFDLLWVRFANLNGAARGLDGTVATYRDRRMQARVAMEKTEFTTEDDTALEQLSAVRTGLLQELDGFRGRQGHHIDDVLQSLSEHSRSAYQWTLFLVIVGMLIGAPIALSVALSIHRSVYRLVQATQAFGSGQFAYRLDETSDEFGHLAREFLDMGRKLQDLEQERLDANPLTHLPGNLAIDRELQLRIKANIPFAHTYIDLDNFKAYNDRYGYQRGSDLIARVGDLIREVVAKCGSDDDLVGHVGGDDYIVLSTPEKAEDLAEGLIEKFDAMVPSFYSEEDREKGAFVAKDRYGVERTFPLMSISVAVVCSDNVNQPTALGISRECARMKEHLKNLPGSNYLVDRRKDR
jgi:diguanylate cyclase (GGDEF)-like protein